MSSKLKFKPPDTYNTTKQVRDFIQASTVLCETLFNTVVSIVTPGVSQPSPLTEISTQDETFLHYDKMKPGWRE
jgi:hypothetical protein